MNVDPDKIWNERWRLAALTTEDYIKIGLFSIMIGLIYVLYHFQGNTTDAKMFSKSAFLWLSRRWDETSGDFSHGWLIPFISLGVLYTKRHELANLPRSTSAKGLAVVILGLLIHWLGIKSQHPRASLFALILLLWGIPFYLYGWKLAKTIIFPAGYLIFAIPLNFLDSLTFPLRIFATIITAGMLNGLGIAVERSGSMIRSVNGSFALDIDDPCSGLRSLLAMTAITAVYAYFTQRTFIKKWLLFLLSIPLAVVGNIIRILTIGLMAQAFGQEMATGIYHDYSGFIFFPVAIGLMIGAGSIINMDLKAVWANWKEKHLEPEEPGYQETFDH